MKEYTVDSYFWILASGIFLGALFAMIICIYLLHLPISFDYLIGTLLLFSGFVVTLLIGIAVANEW